MALVMNVPVKTDLIYDALPDCLRAEQEMRRQWAEVYNDAVRRKADRDTLELVKGQMISGTCVPTK